MKIDSLLLFLTTRLPARAYLGLVLLLLVLASCRQEPEIEEDRYAVLPLSCASIPILQTEFTQQVDGLKGKPQLLTALVDSLTASPDSKWEDVAYGNFKLGQAIYSVDKSAALAPYQAALEIAEQQDTLAVELITRILRNISGILEGQKDYSGTISYATKGIELALRSREECSGKNSNIGTNEIVLAEKMGSILTDMGNLSAAANYLEPTCTLCRSGEYKPWYFCAPALNAYARARFFQGDTTAAVALVDEALTVFPEDDKGWFSADYGQRSLVWETAFEIALRTAEQNTSTRTEQLARAQKFANLSYRNNRQRAKFQQGHANSHINLAAYFIEAGDAGQAQFHLDSALVIRTMMGGFVEDGSVAENQARISLLQGDTTQAIVALLRAEDVYHGYPLDRAPGKAIDKYELRDPLFDRARLTYLQHAVDPGQVPLDSVQQLVRRAEVMNDVLQRNLRPEGAKRSSIRKLREFYEGLITFAEKAYRQSGKAAYRQLAVDAMARSKARVLQERRSYQQRKRTASDKQQEEKIYRKQEEEIALKEKLRRAQAGEQAQLSDQLEKTQYELRQLLDASYVTEQVVAEAEQLPGLTELLPYLREGEAVLDYFVGEKATFLGLAYAGEIRLHRLPLGRSELTKMTTDLRDNLRSSYQAKAGRQWAKRGDVLTREYATLAAGLYRSLLQAALAEIEPTTLTFIPDDALSQLPFSALLATSEPDTLQGGGLANWPYLMSDYYVNHEFSTALSLEHRQAAAAEVNGKVLLLLAGQKADSLDLLAEGKGTYYLPPLLSVAETKEWAKKVDVLEGEQLSEKAWREKLDRKNYALVHFEGHGLIFPDNVYESFLFLGRDEAQALKLLKIPRLERLDLRGVELFILSACDTGNGELSAGEGVISLGRAGALAGAQSVLATLWEVDQGSKKRLLSQFYAALRDGKERHEALALAQRKLLHLKSADYRHPVFWAGFTHTGKWVELSAALR